MKGFLLHIVFIALTVFLHGQQEVVVDYENEYGQDNISPQEEYLNSPIRKKKFNKSRWEDLRREVVEESVGENTTGEELGDADNPYGTSPKEYQKNWEIKKENATKKNKIKPREKSQKENQYEEKDESDPIRIHPLLAYLLLAIVLLGLIGLLFYLFFSSTTSQENKKIQTPLEDIPPSEIQKSELDVLLSNALFAENYREAVRIYFIKVVKEISDAKLIRWEKEKTNQIYVSELKNNSLQGSFESIVWLYEYVWYGKREITKEDFEKIQPSFDSILSKIEIA